MAVENTAVAARDEGAEGRAGIDDALVDRLLAEHATTKQDLLGADGLIGQLAKKVLERALAAELTDHLGYAHGDPKGNNSGNARNGTSPKTVHTEHGSIPLDVPRDRAGTFQPQIVRKHQTLLAGLNERILALYAGGMTVRDIQAHLAELYDVDVSRDLISKVTDEVLVEVREWQSRPLDRVYPVVYLDALVVKVRDEGVVKNAWRQPGRAPGVGCRRRGPQGGPEGGPGGVGGDH